MRLGFLVLSGLFLASLGVHAQTSLQSFDWERNARFELQLTQKNRPVVIRGDLRDGARQSYQSKDLQTTAEIKSYTTELFLVVAVTSEGDETGYIFLLERPVDNWIVMNRQPIRARKVDIMNDFETAIKDFRATTDHTFANILRKMTEYFDQNPNKRLQDLLSALENKDESLRSIPRPRGAPRSGNQGVIPGRVPGGAAPGQGPDALDIFGEEPPARRPRRPAPEEDPYAPRPPGYVGENDRSFESDIDYAARERARQRRLREQRRLQQQQQPQYDQWGNPYPRQRNPYFPSDRPMDLRPPRQQYAPPQYAPPSRPRGFFESLFGQ